jgi:hypothetical protein
MLLTPQRSDEIKARIQAAVEAALEQQDVSARRASLDVVGNDGLVRDIRAGRLPGVDRLEALFEYLGLEFYFGPRRRPPETGRAGSAFAEPEAGMSDLDRREGLRAGYLPIPWHPQTGRTAGQAVPVAFARSWLEAAGLSPDTLAAVRPDPEREGADTVALIDTAAPRRGGPSRWCYRSGGEVRLGEVQFEANATLILPEAPGQPARVLVGDDRARVAFLGRVVWSGARTPEAGDLPRG